MSGLHALLHRRQYVLKARVRVLPKKDQWLFRDHLFGTAQKLLSRRKFPAMLPHFSYQEQLPGDDEQFLPTAKEESSRTTVCRMSPPAPEDKRY